MYCTKCGSPIPAGEAGCTSCAITEAEQPYLSPPMPEAEKSGSWLTNFLAFRLMITPVVINWVYIFTAVVMFFGTIVFITALDGLRGFFISIPVTVVLQIPLRVLFENIMLLFLIREELVEIRKSVNSIKS